YDAIEEEIVRIHSSGRPILVGTTSIEKSELLHERLKMRGIPHEVLNAKHHEREAYIIARAGQREAVTIATNMAGRASRQGDPGSSQFFLSLEDDLFRKFAPPWMKGVLQKMGLKEGERIESGMVSRSIGKAQKNVENHNFDIRKNLVEYDQVRAEQRRVIYTLRQRILEGDDMRATIMEMVERRVGDAVGRFLAKGGESDLAGLGEWFKSKFGTEAKTDGMDRQDTDQVVEELLRQAASAYQAREQVLGLAELRSWITSLARRYMPEHGELVKNFAEFSKQVQERTDVAVPETLVRMPQAEMIDAIAEKIATD